MTKDEGKRENRTLCAPILQLQKKDCCHDGRAIVRHLGFVIRHSDVGAGSSRSIAAAIASLRLCSNLVACHLMVLDFRLR